MKIINTLGGWWWFLVILIGVELMIGLGTSANSIESQNEK
jgi:hypothetical protein